MANSITLERRNVAKKYMEDHASEWITATALAKKFGVTTATIRLDFKLMAKELNGDLECCHGKGYMYIPAAKAENPDEELELAIKKAFGNGKNSEGYSDATAERAIAKVDAERELGLTPVPYIPYIPVAPVPGDIWESNCSNGRVDLILIVKYFPDWSLVLKLFPTVPMVLNSNTPTIEVDDVIYQVDVRKIGCKPNKYLSRKKTLLPDEYFETIQKELEDLFSRDPNALSKLRKENADQAVDNLNLYTAKKELAEANDALAKKIESLKTKLDWASHEQEKLQGQIEAAQTEKDILLSEYERDLKELEALREENEELKKQTTVPATENLELAVLKAKVEIYEKLIFERGLPV